MFDQIEALKRQYSDKYVVVDEQRPELQRFAGRTGQVKTVNMSGRALVEFDGGDNNIGWFDIDLDFLKVVDQPLPKPEKKEEREKAPAAKAPAAAKPAAEAKPAAKKSTADILAAARGGAKAAPAGGAEQQKQSTADILAAARRPKGSGGAATESPAPAAPAQPAAPKKMSTADILAAARGKQAATPAPSAPAPPAAEEAVQWTVEEEQPAEEAPAEEAAAAEAPPPAEKPAKPATGDLPKATAEIIAWCRAHDGK